MTNKKLHELFELPDDGAEVNTDFIEKAEVAVFTQEAYSNLEKIENALPQVRGLEASDNEMAGGAKLVKRLKKIGKMLKNSKIGK